jgi:streptogramin lyase
VRQSIVVTLALAVLVATAGATTQGHEPTLVPLAGYPTSVVAAFGSVWVGSHRATFLYRIDPSANRVAARIDISENLCWVPTTAKEFLWVSNCEGESDEPRVYQVDPRTNRVVRQAPGNAPAYGAGSLWTVDDQMVVRRIDPRSGIVLDRIELHGFAPFGRDGDPYVGGVGLGSVWVGSCARVARISTSTERVEKVIRLPDDPGCPGGAAARGYLGGDRIAFIDGRAWIAAPFRIYVVDPQTNTAQRTPIRLAPHTQWGDDSVVAARGSLWVRSSDDVVSRIDPSRLRAIETFPTAGGGGDIAVAFGSLWAVDFAGNSVWREPLG